MAKAKNTALPEELQEKSLSSQILRGLREGVLIVFGMLALFLLVSLVTYDSQDPSWSFTGDGVGLNNLGGIAGAWFADLAFILLGYLAYLIPVIFLVVGWWLFRHRRVDRIASPLELSLRGAALLVTLLAATGLAALHWLPGALPAQAGGVSGDLIGSLVAETMGLVGGTLFLLALLLTGFTLFTGMSWFGLMDSIGEKVIATVHWVQQKARGWREQRIRYKQESEQQQHSDTVLPAEHAVESSISQTPPFHARTATRQEPELPKVPVTTRQEPELPKASITTRQDPELPKVLVASRSVVEKKSSSGESRSGATLTGALPSLELLDEPPPQIAGYSEESLQEMSRLVEVKLRDFGVEVEVVAVQPGPVITRFELHLAPGIKVARISSLAKDLARSLSVIAVRIVEVIPGKSTVGLEIPNQQREIVALSEILQSALFDKASAPLTLALGKDIGGAPVVADLARMPHLLVAGTTGSGKSVGVNAMLISMLYKCTPDEVRLILIDPKMLELSIYEGIPHLLAPVVTDMKDAANALRWAVAEMERRYRLMSFMGVRNILGFNKRLEEAVASGEPILDPFFDPNLSLEETTAPALEPLPYIVVVVDEFADMIMVVGKKVEELIARLAQKARAAGIHLILATQRPSVDVITGLIKANIPTRIAFQVSSRVDSRTILDQMGAEHLLGHGDMLYLPPGKALPERVHGAFVADHEVHQVVEYIRLTGEPDYDPSILNEPEPGSAAIPGLETVGAEAEGDPLYDQAVQIVIESRKASISYIQRRLKIGYNRAARMIEDMENAGLVSPLQSNGNREVLVPSGRD